MGLEGIGIWQLLIILAIVAAVFGTKKLRNVGDDLGAAMRSFRSAMHDDGKHAEQDSEAKRESLDDKTDNK